MSPAAKKASSAAIRRLGDAVLREKAEAVQDIKSPEIQELVSQMRATLETAKNGVALAAPQIGASKRIIVVSHRVFDGTLDDEKAKPNKDLDLILINPELCKLSKDKEWMEEGCLSIPGVFGEVRRSTKATVRAYGLDGKKFERGGSGLLAQIFQHEMDHLDGILFVDKARNLVDTNEK